ncbi:hypothetical protein ACHQM5_000778 [Ranunculus cassubicifolius]
MMTPPPVEQTGESNGGGDAQKTLPTPFLTKTYQLVDDLAVDDIISWNEDGSTFVVWKPAEFARDLLPKYFKHNNFSSFVRQLNTYGFRKIVPDRWEFANDCFKKGEKKLLCEIHRRKLAAAVGASNSTPMSVSASPVVIQVGRNGSPSNSGEEQVLSSNSPPVTVSPIMCRSITTTSCTNTADLLEENERLRRENLNLSQELSQMKSLCNNIYVLMTKYANSQSGNDELTERPLDLMPMKRCENQVAGQSSTKVEDDGNPRLFGVPIGTKRSRSEGEEDQGLDEGEKEPVKSEPLDSNSSPNDSGWMLL